MPRPEEEFLPAHTWRVLGIAAVGLLVSAVVGMGLISAGVFDPQPVGDLQVLTEPGRREVVAGEGRIDWVGPAVPATFSARLLAAYERGERDVGYGLALGEPEAHLGVAVSPLGYVTVWEESDAGRTEHVPWQTWPHVRPGRKPNEIEIDVREGEVEVRLNRELLWQGSVAEMGGGMGLYVESFGGPGAIGFRELALFYE